MISSRQRATSTGPWTTAYFLSDRLSVRMTLNWIGNVSGRQGHLPFGENFAESGTQEKQHFTSYERDTESGLDYAINRGYATSVGRFLSADPYRASGYLVDPQSWNRYRYSRNDPVNLVDPLGLFEDARSPFSGLYGYVWGWAVIEQLLDGSEDAAEGNPPQNPRRLEYTRDLDSYVTAYFADPSNKDCAEEFKKRGVDQKPFLEKAKKAWGLDFLNKNAFFHTTVFSSMPTDFFHPQHLSGPQSDQSPETTVNNGASPLDLITFNRQNIIVFGSKFDNFSPAERNLAMTHEVLRLYFDTPSHTTIAEKLGLGTISDDNEAAIKINTFLRTNCGRN